MLDTGRLEIIEVNSRSPSLINQNSLQLPNAVQELGRLSGADGKINPLIRLCRKRTRVTDDRFSIPECGWRYNGKLAKDRRVFEAQIKRNQAAQRHAAKSRVGSALCGPIVAINERLDFFDQHTAIQIGMASRFWAVARGRSEIVYSRHTTAGNSDDNERVDRRSEE